MLLTRSERAEGFGILTTARRSGSAAGLECTTHGGGPWDTGTDKPLWTLRSSLGPGLFRHSVNTNSSIPPIIKATGGLASPGTSSHLTFREAPLAVRRRWPERGARGHRPIKREQPGARTGQWLWEQERW